MCSKHNKRFKSKRFQHSYRNKLLKTLTKHISCECKCEFDGKKCDSNHMWNNDKCQCECKNPKECYVCKKYYIWNPATCSCENGKYVGNVIDDSVITQDEITDTTKQMF